VVSVKRRLSDFDMEKDEWYYQPIIYINRKDSNSLYYELKEFRISLSNETSTELTLDNLISEFSKEETEEPIKKLQDNPQEQDSKIVLQKNSEAGKAAGFFEDKLKILKDEIEDINRNLEERKLIEKTAADSIESEIKEVKRQLHEIYTWKQGEKSTIEFIRMEFLKQLASLNREKRQSSLGFWKDRVFEKKDRRNMLLEYKSLDWMGALTRKKGKEKKQ
jgi:hypothetical protein